MASRFETVLSDDVLNYCVISMLHYRDAVALSAANSHLRTRTRMRIKEIKASLPPPFSPETLDKALAANDIVNSTRLLRIAVSRLRRNLETISSRLLERGYPVATNCALCGRRYLAPMEDIDERVAALRATGVEVPLILVELWRHLGGFALAVCTHRNVRPSCTPPSSTHTRSRPQVLAQSPMDLRDNDWWSAVMPEVAAHFAPGAEPHHAMPDPLWLDHGTAVLRSAGEDGDTQHEYTLPVGFSDEEGFAFRTGRVLHLAPDAMHKRTPHASAATAPGTYAVWLEPSPPLDPELLRFTPPADDELGGVEPLWRSQCSLLRYLRLAVLHAGGFPGCVGVEPFEPLRVALTEGLMPF